MKEKLLIFMALTYLWLHRLNSSTLGMDDIFTFLPPVDKRDKMSVTERKTISK